MAKVTKTVLPRKPPTPPCASRRPRRSPNSPGAHDAPRARTRDSRQPRCRLRCSGGGYGARSTKLPGFCRWAPYGVPEHRKPLAERPQGRARDRARGPSGQGGPVGTPSSQRRVREGVVAPSGFAFLLVTFLWQGKEKLPAVGQPPTSICQASPKATQKNKKTFQPEAERRYRANIPRHEHAPHRRPRTAILLRGPARQSG